MAGNIGHSFAKILVTQWPKFW